MCGKPLDEAAPPQIAAGKPEERAEARAPHDEQPVPAPAYTGGIFNLGAPTEKAGRNLDYLLEDDEPRSHKGLMVGIVALILVAGLGYLRWRGDLSWLKAVSSAPKNSAQTADSQAGGPGGDQAGSPGPASSNTPNTPPDAGQHKPAPPSAVVTAPSATSATPPPSAPAPAPAATGPAPTSAIAPGETSSPGATPAGIQSPESKPVSPVGDTPAAGQALAPPPTAGDTTAPPAAIPAAAPVSAAPTPEAPPPPKPKPKAKPLPPPKPEDSVAMGERYLYGRGVPQDCTRGLRYVKPAADQSNPKAMITMGALYATGHCLSRDLPTAYRFFALALRKDPENGALKRNAEMVWSQMTAAEREQAIRMTQ